MIGKYFGTIIRQMNKYCNRQIRMKVTKSHLILHYFLKIAKSEKAISFKHFYINILFFI